MPTQRGLKGHLDLVCALDERGKSIIARQSFRAPMHLSKPWLEGDTLIVHLVNQTAGLLAGDVIATNIAVEPGARLLVTTPSASRAHRTNSGEIRLQQHFQVADQAWLEFYPELFIPQAGTTCRQTTRIELASGASLLYIDTLAPGRVASGESFLYNELDWRTDLLLDGIPLVRERSRFIPDRPNLLALRRVFPNAYYGTIYFVVPQTLEGLEAHFADLQNFDLWIGISRFNPRAWAIKLLAADSPRLRSAVQWIRSRLYAVLSQPEPILRKI